MFKLVVLFALLAIVAARPGVILEPTLYSSAIVGSVPASISSQSSTVIHRHAAIAPIVHAAPLVHSVPIVHGAPIISTYAAPAVVAAPAHVALHASPLLHL